MKIIPSDNTVRVLKREIKITKVVIIALDWACRGPTSARRCAQDLCRCDTLAGGVRVQAGDNSAGSDQGVPGVVEGVLRVMFSILLN